MASLKSSRLLFDEAGRHASSAFGLGSFPHGMVVEVEAVMLVREGSQRRWSSLNVTTPPGLTTAYRLSGSKTLYSLSWT
ncbi:hypothetical protein OKW43_004332 [Paraburkholderia sp. WC7.3g]